MSVKLYPPYINGTLPAFWLNYDASKTQVIGASITIPFSDNPAASDSIKGYSLRLRTASTGSYLFEPIYTTQKDTEENTVTFSLTATQAKKLKEGQFYKAQVAYCGSGGATDPGYYSTVGIIKCTSKPTVSISNLSLENINFFTGDFIGLYDQTNCKDQTEKVYSYSFQIYDENGDIYYDTGELLHNASYDTDYNYSIDRVSINEFVSQEVTYSVQYNVTTLNGLQLSTGQYRLTNEGFASLNRDITIIPESNLENGYITIKFKGELDKDRSFYYVLNEDQLDDEKDNNGNYLFDAAGATVLSRLRESLTGTTERLSFMKNNNVYRYYIKGLDFPYRYTVRNRDMTGYISTEINGKIYYRKENEEIQIEPTYYYIDSYDEELHPIKSQNAHTLRWINENRKKVFLDENQQMIQGEDSISTPLYQLAAVGKDLIRSLTYNYIEENGFFVNEQGRLQSNEGIIYQLIDKEEYEAFYYGAYLLSRASDKDNYATWEKINRFRLEEQPPSSYSVKDFTIEHGRKYIYSLQQYNLWGLYSTRVVSDVYQAGFEDAFLYDGKRALKIRFNPEVSSFKTTILEQKTDTLGGRFPYITRNGETYYKEFPIGGLIAAEMDDEELFINRGLVTSHRHSTSAVEANEPANTLRDYHMFSDENIMLERQFKLEVLNWLNDGKPKLFKSPYEGNYIVRLMNTSLTPVKELGRMLHSFQTTAYEIAECNYDNLVRFGFIDTSEPSDTIGLWNTINLADYPAGRDIDLNFGDGELVSFSVQDMMPGDIIEIQYASGEPATEKIMIGITGAYICAGIDRKIIGVHIPPRHLIPDIGDKNEQKMTGIINCYYQGARITAFDAIAGMQLKTIPSYQFIGVDPKLETMKLVDWTDKNNYGTFINALTTGQFKTFQGYTLRDYLDQMVEKTETVNGQTQYYISSKGQKYIAGFDPGDLISRIDATLNSGEADKIKMIKLEQGHFRLRELVPVYVLNGDAALTGTQQDNWLVSVSPFGYPHPIEELINFEMIDPFCVFEVYKIKDGRWVPVQGPYNNSPYYDPYYKDWLYDYEPYIKMNYQIKKISFVNSESTDKPYKRSDLVLTTNSETGQQYYTTNNGFAIPENRIYDFEIHFDESQPLYKYYYEDPINYDVSIDENTGEIIRTPQRIYLTAYNYFDSLEPQPIAAYSLIPTVNAVYCVKQYDSTIDLSIVKEKNYKDFENINSIHLGTGVMAEMTFQIKVIDYYTEINQQNTAVIEAKNAYLEAAAFYRTIMQTYATIAAAEMKKSKYTALERLYERLLRGKNQTNLSDLNNADIQTIETLLGHTADRLDLNLLDIYEAIILNSDNIGTDLLDYLINLFNTDTILESRLAKATDINDVKNMLDNILIYTTAYNDYSIVDLNSSDIEIVNAAEDENITLDNLLNYNYYQYINLESNIVKYYFVKKADENIQNLLNENINLVEEKVAYKPTDNGYVIVEDITNLNGETVQKLSKAYYDRFYNERMMALNKEEYKLYKNNNECLWIQLFDKDKTQLYEEQEIKNVLTTGVTFEGAQTKLAILENEIKSFTDQIDEIQAKINNSDIAYKTAYETLTNAITQYNNSTYFYWGLTQLYNVLNSLDPNTLSLPIIDAYLNNATLNLNTKEAIATNAVRQIKTTVENIVFNASEDFSNIKVYEKIINDKENDSSLDEYHKDQIRLSCGKVLKIAYELFFCGLLIIFIINFFKEDLPVETLKEFINIYKNIGNTFKTTFDMCLINNEINEDYKNGFIEYYNNLLKETSYLLTTMQNNWESVEEVNTDNYRLYRLNRNELEFLNFILREPNTTYNAGIDSIISDREYVSPLMRQNNINYFIQQANLTNQVQSYINTNYSLKTNEITALNTVLIETWMIEENAEGNSYIQSILDRADLLRTIEQEENYTPYKKYISTKTGDSGNTFNRVNSEFTSFIYNPLSDGVYKQEIIRYSFVNGQTYYTKDDNTYNQAIDITEFDDEIEYYFFSDEENRYICVNNLKTHSYMNNPNNYQLPAGYETIIDTTLPQFYFYDEESQKYIKLSENDPFRDNIQYYIHRKLDNLDYFNALENEQKKNVLDISLNANNVLIQIVEFLQTKANITNGIIQENIRSILSMDAQAPARELFKDYPVPNLDQNRENLNAALKEYNDLVTNYQHELQESYTTEEYKNKLAEFDDIDDPTKLYSLKLDKTLNNLYLPPDTEEEMQEFPIDRYYELFVSDDLYHYFYCHHPDYDTKPETAIIINELPTIQYYDIYFLPKMIKFFTEIKNDKLDTTGIAYWHKESLEKSELKKYTQLLEEAIELQELYQQQYANYLEKYERYASEAKESSDIYNSYFDDRGQPTEEMKYYQENDSNNFEEQREKVRELWWAFLNILDDTYTAEKARGMYV